MGNEIKENKQIKLTRKSNQNIGKTKKKKEITKKKRKKKKKKKRTKKF